MKFLHAADVHLDSPLRGLERYEGAPSEEIRGATRRAFENLVDLALEEEVACVLLAGDLYDGDWRDYNTGLFFTRQLGRLREAGIRVCVIAGNHDAASQITKVLRPPDNVHLFSTRAPESLVLEDLGIAVHGQGFPTRAVTEDLSQRYPPPVPGLFNIGLLHTSLDGRPGHEPYAPCSLDGLRSRGYAYWALGHVHQRELVCKDPWVLFPGNTQGRNVRETGSKGCSLVVVEDGRVQGVEHRPLDRVRWTVGTLDLDGAGSLDEVYDRTGRVLEGLAGMADGRLLAVRLRLCGACAVSARLRAAREGVVNECRALANTLGGGALWVEKLEIDTRPVASEEAALAREDAFGGLLRAIRDLELDAAGLSGLRGELEEVRLKLPPELTAGADMRDPTGPEAIREALEDVKALLTERLLSGGGGT